MKKSLISLAIATGMAASGAAFAEATVYGNVHLSIDDNDRDLPTDEIKMNSRTSAIGVKGSEDLGDGMKALYKVEFQIDPSDRCNSPTPSIDINDAVADGGNGDGAVDVAEVDASISGCDAITDRDQWVGLKGGMGTVKFGTMSSNYKQMGGKVDPMYRTALEGRGFMRTQSSKLHGGAGIDRGRSTKTVQYSSPKMGGMQLIVNTTLSGATGDDDETNGLGFRYAGKGFSAYFDWIDMDAGATSESATKVGGKFKAGPVAIGAQYESAEDLDRDYIFLSANYGIDKNNAVAVTLGQRDDSKTATSSNGSDAFAILYNHKMSKKTNVYAGYGDRSDDAGGPGESNVTLGLRKKF